MIETKYFRNQRKDIENLEQFKMLKDMAEKEGLYLGVMEYFADAPIPKENGTYIILCPNDKYAFDIRTNANEIRRLLAKQKEFGYDRFNPCYWFFDVTKFDYSNVFNMFMDISRAIQHEAVIINACRELGYDIYPCVMDRYTTAEIHKLDKKRKNPAYLDEERAKLNRAYKDFIAHVYHNYVDKENDQYIRPNLHGKIVAESWFSENKVPVVHDKVNQYFLKYFEEKIEEYPDFYYSINKKKPAVKLMDLSKHWKGNPIANPYKNDKEVELYNITFPVSKQHIFYRILLEFNYRDCRPETALVCVGNTSDLEKIIIDQNDMWNWDSLCRANNIKYYMNKGDIAVLDADGTRDITVAFNKKDKEKVTGIMNRLFREQMSALPVKQEQVEQNNNTIDRDHEQLQRNPEIKECNVDLLESRAKKAGYTDIDFNRG